MLQCLDDNKPVKAIDLKDAVFMMAKAWDNVSTTTIKNCWKKAGFPGEVEEPSHDPFESDDEDEDTDELDGGLWGNITHHFPSLAETSFSNFVSFDDNVVTENQPTEEDVTRHGSPGSSQIRGTDDSESRRRRRRRRWRRFRHRHLYSGAKTTESHRS